MRIRTNQKYNESTYYNFHYFTTCLNNYLNSEIDEEISSNDAMANEWYFEVGNSAVQNIIASCLSSNLPSVSNVLDMPCGHGRILRHLVKLFPEASFTACDLDSDGVNFCADKFGANKLYSNEDLTKTEFKGSFDLIWIGSLFTHTSRAITRKWITHLSHYLSANGIMIITVHGRWSKYVHQSHPYIMQSSWDAILGEYEKTGYGYADYARSETHKYIEGSYGVSLAKASAIMDDIETIPGLRIFGYRERAWADHQDVLVVGKPAFDKPWL